MGIDVNFDTRTDAGTGDPDKTSRTLRSFHQLLWSKELPSGEFFTLEARPASYLVHDLPQGPLFLASDSISNSLRSQKRRAELIAQISSSQLDEFQRLGSTIGAKTLFPGKRVAGNPTINVARGFNPLIGDRMDLTVECIRRHYQKEPNPLEATLNGNSEFFRLFEDFEGYVSFFLLQDLVDGKSIKFYLPFVDFAAGKVLPTTVDEYHQYMEATMDFVEARNARIQAWATQNLI